MRTAEHAVTIRHNGGRIGDQGSPGKPSAYFLDCTCGWGCDYVTTDREEADAEALRHALAATSGGSEVRGVGPMDTTTRGCAP